MLPPKPPSIPDEPTAPRPTPPAPARRDGFTIVALLFSGMAVLAGALAFLRSSQTYQLLAQLQQKQNDTAKIANVAPTPTPPAQFVDLTIDDNDAIAGNSNAKVTLVEFSDFECPFCKQYAETTKKIREQYSPDQVRFVYKHFPLTSIHTEAEPAAIAAQCVSDLAGDAAFFTYHDQLFARQDELGQDLYYELAASISSLDQAAFKDCYTNKTSLDAVQADYAQGLAAEVAGTPSTFINGERIQGGAVPFATIKALIDAALAK